MRWTVIAICLLLAGCCTTPSEEPERTYPDRWFEGKFNYELARPGQLENVGDRLVVDLTLLDFDVRMSEQMLGMSDLPNISPDAFDKPVGEMAAAVALALDAGEVLARSRIAVQAGVAYPLQFVSERVYLKDWSVGGSTRPMSESTPIVDTIEVGVSGELRIEATIDYSFSITAETLSRHPETPFKGFTTSFGIHKPVVVQRPEINLVQRLGVETVKRGQTAVFQLSRAKHENGDRIRLLFVRIAESGS